MRLVCQLKDFHILHCLDVLRDLVQEEDIGRNGWTTSKKIACAAVNLTLVKATRVAEDRRFTHVDTLITILHFSIPGAKKR